MWKVRHKTTSNVEKVKHIEHVEIRHKTTSNVVQMQYIEHVECQTQDYFQRWASVEY